MATEGFPSIKEVAEQAGVSTSTASRVLNQQGYVSDASRARVLRAAADLGYEPDLAARALRSRSSTMLGLVVQDITNPFYASVARGVATAARPAYVPFLSDSQEDPALEGSNLRELLQIRVAGLIIVPTAAGNLDLLQRFLRLSIPIVQVDDMIPELPTDAVGIDNFRAGHDATSHLIERGHRLIAQAAQHTHSPTGRERLRGCLAACADAGFELDPRYVTTSDYRRESGALNAMQLLDQYPAPTAIVAHSNVLAESILKVIAERGLRVPEDVAVVGIDDPDWAKLVSPPLTVVSQPAFSMGVTAVELLISRLRGNEEEPPPRHVTLRAELLIRGSSGGP